VRRTEAHVNRWSTRGGESSVLQRYSSVGDQVRGCQLSMPARRHKANSTLREGCRLCPREGVRI